MYKPLRCDKKLLAKDLTGKVYIVTGANSGVGLETTKQLVKQGAHVVMACRRVDAGEMKAKQFIHHKGKVKVIKLDLADLESIRKFAKSFLDDYDRLDALVNNAGIATFRSQPKRTRDGFEMMFGVNHLGHFLLTELLIDRLIDSTPSRVVCISSIAHTGNKKSRRTIHFEDLNYEKREFRSMNAYGESKLANLLYARELGIRMKSEGVTAVSVHPGWARSHLGGRGVGSFIQNVLMVPIAPFITLLSNEDAAQTSLHCILDDDIPNHPGEYYSQNGLMYSDKECRSGGWPMKSPNEHAHDDIMAKKLTQISRELVGLDD